MQQENKRNIFPPLKLSTMKSHPLFFAFIYLISLAACKKEDLLQDRGNVVAQKVRAATQDNKCSVIEPSNFVKKVTNPYFPLKPHTTYYYINRIVEDKVTIEHNTVTVTSNTKIILGVTCTVVHDEVKVEGLVSEDTY